VLIGALLNTLVPSLSFLPLSFDLSHLVEKVSSTSKHNWTRGDIKRLPSTGCADERGPLISEEQVGRTFTAGRGCCCPLSWPPGQHRPQSPCTQSSKQHPLSCGPQACTREAELFLEGATDPQSPPTHLHPAGASSYRKISNLTLKPWHDEESSPPLVTYSSGNYSACWKQPSTRLNIAAIHPYLKPADSTSPCSVGRQ